MSRSKSDDESVNSVEALTAAIDDALALLAEGTQIQSPISVQQYEPESLLEQCLKICSEDNSVESESIRTIHHFACTGGSLITKCIAAMPNTHVFSEVDPLSTLQGSENKHRFAPTDMITLARQSTRSFSEEILLEMYMGNVSSLYKEGCKNGYRLVFRDHAHSHYCVGDEIPDRPNFLEILSCEYKVNSIVTVRNPLDSYLSLLSNRWLHFRPKNLNEYCQRYLAFLDSYCDVPIVKYEDFVDNPRDTMKIICEYLNIPFNKDFVELFNVFEMTGDSGRTSGKIEGRARRPIESNVLYEVEKSDCYRELITILNYK